MIPRLASISLMSKSSPALPLTLTRSPTARAGGQSASHVTMIPSDVAGSASTSASSSCNMNPFSTSSSSSSDVTIASTVTRPVIATLGPEP